MSENNFNLPYNYIIKSTYIQTYLHTHVYLFPMLMDPQLFCLVVALTPMAGAVGLSYCCAPTQSSEHSSAQRRRRRKKKRLKLL